MRAAKSSRKKTLRSLRNNKNSNGFRLGRVYKSSVRGVTRRPYISLGAALAALSAISGLIYIRYKK